MEEAVLVRTRAVGVGAATHFGVAAVVHDVSYRTSVPADGP